MMHTLNIDLETFSSEDIKTGGLYRYVQSPDFEILLLAYSLDGGPVRVIDLAQGEVIPADIQALLFDADTIKPAYNAAFEWYCLAKHFGLDEGAALTWLPQWRCTQLHGLYCGYPAGLDAVGKALALPEAKRKKSTGQALIRTFCMPCKPGKSNGGRTRTLPQHEPEKWRLFKEYNAQDVVTEMEVARRLSFWPVPPDIQQQWELDLKINARGVAVDMQLVVGALDCAGRTNDRLMEDARTLTGLDNPNSVGQLKAWLEQQTGTEITSLDKEAVQQLLDSGQCSPGVVQMLEIRQELGKTSTKKFDAMAAAVCQDGRIRGLLQFYGANRTGRWAGRFVQPQNLPRTHLAALEYARELVKDGKLDALRMIYGNVPNMLSQLVRTAFVPAEGCIFLDADFSAIEARVLAWLAGEQWRLEVFRTHGKIYEASASQMFGVPLEDIVKGRPEYELRQRGKVAELALGYQGGVNALTTMDTGKALKEEEKPEIVARWRQANKRIVALWRQVQNAAMQTVRTGQQTGIHGLLFTMEGAQGSGQYFMTITLPSGRKLFYCRPSIIPGEYGDALQYWGMHQTKKQWYALETYGGKLVENIVQAIARDCLAESLKRLDAMEYPVVFHVHDEVLVEVPAGHEKLEEVCKLISYPMPWAPDLVLAADGWVGEWYRKE